MPNAIGEFEIVYGGPWGGIDYSRPPNTIDKNNLAPGSVNTQQINGFLGSSPWVASSPYSTTFAANEVVIGQFEINTGQQQSLFSSVSQIIFVTNVGVYISTQPATDTGSPKTKGTLTLVHAWIAGEFNNNFLSAGSVVSFVETQTEAPSNNTSAGVFFTGMMLEGVFKISFVAGVATLNKATGYVCGRYITELGGRLVIGEAMFPTGGGPFGYFATPTIAWSGVGAFSGSGATDPWNPANFATLSGNVGGFNLLTDVPDQITGLATIGRSAMIARENGISQMDPGPSGIDPFIFYHLWASPQGVGAFNNTFQQFGQSVLFKSSDNIYSISIQGGIQPLGNQIIAKMNADARTAGFQGGNAFGWAGVGGSTEFWDFGSIVTIAGQLHYLLVFNSFTEILGSSTTFSGTCFLYDLNLAENSWSFCDFSQYFQQSSTGAGFLFMSCPILDCNERFGFQGPPPGPTRNVVVNLKYLLFGGITTALSNSFASAQLFQLVPFDYDVNTNPYNAYWAPVFTPLSVPATTIKFRQEVIALGHKVTFRKLRMQAMNAPFPTAVAGEQQQIQVSMVGNNGQVQNSPIVSMNADSFTQTYYGDVTMTDEMGQPSITAVFGATTPWVTLPMVRFSTVSLIGTDTKGTTA